jgi:hypothetical protein
MPTASTRKREIVGWMIFGAALFAVGIAVGGGAVAWWFLAGPAGEAAALPVAAAAPSYAPSYPSGQPFPAGPLPPPIAGPPAAITYPPAPLESLPAIPTDPGSFEAGHSPKGEIHPCFFNGGEDPIQNAVRDALRAKGKEMRFCAVGVEDTATARFAFTVAAGATRMSGLRASTNSGMESCLRTSIAAVSISTTDPAARTGDVVVTMKGPAGAELCNVQVGAKRKAD